LPPQHLGHEIHVGRCIVVDLVREGILQPHLGDCVITSTNDRKFLYEGIFSTSTVFDLKTACKLKEVPDTPREEMSYYLNVDFCTLARTKSFPDCEFIDLSAFACPRTYCDLPATEKMLDFGYNIPERFFNTEFVEICKKINYLLPAEFESFVPSALPFFILFHDRYSFELEKLKLSLIALPLNFPKIIFTSRLAILKQELRGLPNLFLTDSLRLYASLLNDPRCRLLISEWSGAGQLSQYTMGAYGQVWYFYNHYEDFFNFCQTHRVWERNAHLGSYLNCWDFKNISGCFRRHFKSFEDLLPALRSIAS